jgi:hypothetical protein
VTTATAIRGLHPRVELLLRIIRAWGGEWGPSRVRTAYLAHGYAASKGTTASADLLLLHRAGFLHLHKYGSGDVYTLRER